MVRAKRSERREQYERENPTMTGRVPATVKDACEKKAAERGVPVSQLINEALIRGLAPARDEWKGGYDAGKAVGDAEGYEKGLEAGYEDAEDTYINTVMVYCASHAQPHCLDLNEDKAAYAKVRQLFAGRPCPRCERGEPPRTSQSRSTRADA